MSKIKLTTVTPVHIGSGVVLRNNIDFVQGNLDGSNYLGVIDPNKLWKLLGAERLDSWVATIERGEDIKEFVKKFSKTKATIEDYSSRLIFCPIALNMAPNEEMKEFIHDGLGKPYIPGSSLKGAIRTAILSQMVQDKQIDVDAAVATNAVNHPNGKPKYSAKSNIEKELFGADPNSDGFRFLQVGDAIFDKECEDVLNMTNLNIRESRSFLDGSKHQLVEVIEDRIESSIFNLNIVNNSNLKSLIDSYNQYVKSWNSQHPEQKKKNQIQTLEIADTQTLFSLINKHTLKLLNDEKAIWGDYVGEDGVEEYLEAIKSMIHAVKRCSDKECILRVGHASGWRFTTGAWTEKLNDEKWDGLVNAARPNNNRYEGMEFPKSRRINYDKGYNSVTLLGFVKLTIQN